MRISPGSLIFILLAPFIAFMVNAQSQPQTLTLDGRLYDAADQPLVDPSVNIRIKILDPSLACVLYEETQTVNTSATDGAFTVRVGAGTRSGDDPGNTMISIFQNSADIPATNTGCATGYDPDPGDVRYFRLSVTPSSTGVTANLSPEMLIDSVPSALVAETLQGLAPTDVLLVKDDATTDLTQSALEGIFSSTNLPLLNALLAGTSAQYMRRSTTAGAALPVYSGNPSSTAAGSIWYDSVTNTIKYNNGTGTPQTVGTGGAGLSSLTVTSDLTADGVAGDTLNAPGTIGLANSGVTAGEYTKVTVDAKGRVTAGDVLDNADLPTSISVTSVSATTGALRTLRLTNATNQTLDIVPPASITGTPTFTWPGTTGTANQVLQTNGSGTLGWAFLSLADIRSTVTPGNTIFPTSPCAANETLHWSVLTDTFDCQDIDGLDASAITAGTIDAARLPNTVALVGGNNVTATMDIGTNAAYDLNLETNSVPRVTVTSAGNIGIGTTSPTRSLEVMNTSSPSNAALFTANNGTNTSFVDISHVGLQVTRTSTNSWPTALITSGDNSNSRAVLQLKGNAGSTDVFFAASNGNVGIGTTSPGYRIDVYDPTLTASTETLVSRLSGPSGRGVAIGYFTNSGATAVQEARVRSVGAVPLLLGTSAYPRAVTILESNGNVGIGTTAPLNAFDVNGVGQIGLRNRPNQETALIVYNEGNQQVDRGVAMDLYSPGPGAGGNGARATARLTTANSALSTQGGYLTLQTENTSGTMTERVRVVASGNVGVGTTSPTTKLEVSGSLKLGDGGETCGATYAGVLRYNSGNIELCNGTSWNSLSGTGSTVGAGAGSVGSPSFTFSGNTNTGFYSSAADQIGISAGGAQVFNISSSGLVSPTTGGGSVSTANGTASAPTFSFSGDTDTGWFRPAADNLAASTAGAERVRINDNGNVGIGTTSPGSQFVVSGVSQVDANFDVTGSRSGMIQIEGGATSTGSGGGVLFSGYGDTFAAIRGSITSATNYGTGDLLFNTRSTSTDPLLRERMRILANGHIGIGTTAPGYPLVVSGTASGSLYEAAYFQNLSGTDGASARIYLGGNTSSTRSAYVEGINVEGGGTGNEHALAFGTSGTASAPVERMRISHAGYVGIGTTAPDGALTLMRDQANVDLNIKSYSSSITGIIRMSRAQGTAAAPTTSLENDTVGMLIGQGYSGLASAHRSLAYIKFEVDGEADTGGTDSTDMPGRIAFHTTPDGYHVPEEKVRITNAGRVGIGTTSPTSTLHLKAGTASAGTSPLKFTSGTVLTTPEDGSMEFDGTNFYLTAGGARRTVASSTSGGALTSVSTISNASGGITLSPSAGNSVQVSGGTTSTSSTSGALIVTGGAGISENLNVGGNIMANGNISAATATAATVGANSNSPSIYLTANYWTGAASAIDRWSITNILGTGSNPTSTLTFDHPTGTSGTKQYAFLNGNVGIGTTEPGEALSVASSATGSVATARFSSNPGGAGAGNFNSIVLDNLQGAANKKNSIRFSSQGTNQWAIGNDVTGNGSHNLYIHDAINNVQRLYIDGSNGNVGIGSTAPETKLQINGSGTSTVLGQLDTNLRLQTNTGTVGGGAEISFRGSSGTAADLATYAAISAPISSNGVNPQGDLVFSTKVAGTTSLSERMRVTYTGNVGIGATSPDFGVGYGTVVRVLGVAGDGSANAGSSGTIALANNRATPTVGDTAGSVDFISVGNGSGVAQLGARVKSILSGSGGANGFGHDLAFYTKIDNSAGISEKMRVLANGNVGIGTSSPNEKLQVNGNVKATAFISTSDRRLKTDVRAVPGLASVRRLNGVRYNWIADGKPDMGVIAQNVEEVFPEAVVTDRINGYKAVKYQSLIAPLIESTKELYGMCEGNQTEIKKVTREIASLREENQKLLQTNQSLQQQLLDVVKRLERLERNAGDKQ